MQKHHGLTLIELLIAMTIVGILAAIAYPSYTQYMLRTRRSEAYTALLQTAAILENYYVTNKNYQGANVANIKSNNAWYKITVSTKTNSYKLTATPLKSQAKDLECANFTLSSIGEQAISGTGNPQHCWGG